MVANVAPVLEKLLGGFGTFVADELRKVFGQNDAATKLEAIVKQAETLVAEADQSAVDTAAWLKGQWPTIEELLAMFPGLEHSIYVRYTIMADNPGVTHGVAAKVTEAAHGNLRAVSVKP
jgi:hypothetical protein